MSPLPTRAHVLETLFQHWAPISRSETVPTIQALGRVPVQDLYAQVSIPVVRAATMDGVAVASSRFCGGIPDMSHWKIGEDFCRADTGDDFDDRFDAVIPIEQVEFPPEGGLRLHDISSVQPGDRVRPCGSTIRKGQLLVPKHRQLPVWPWAAWTR